MDNQITFLKNIRKALGKAPDIKRSKTTFPELFSSPDTTETLKKIHSRTVAEQDELVEILRTNGNDLNVCTHIVESFKEAAAVVVDLIRTKEPEFNHTKHVILHDIVINGYFGDIGQCQIQHGDQQNQPEGSDQSVEPAFSVVLTFSPFSSIV